MGMMWWWLIKGTTTNFKRTEKKNRIRTNKIPKGRKKYTVLGRGNINDFYWPDKPKTLVILSRIQIAANM
jgi:hypothetical protein